MAEALFDETGRRIPKDLYAEVSDANCNFGLDQLKLNEEVDFANRIMRLHGCLSIDTKVTAEQLKVKTERLLAIIRDNSQIANITNGVYLPIVLPKLVTDDLGAELELYLAGVDNSCAKTLSKRSFRNYLRSRLSGKVSIVNESRHNRLISQMKQGPVIGLHFPNPLQSYSINACREQTSTLPEGFILSGMDTPIAMTMYPDVLARDQNAPNLNLTALHLDTAPSLSFENFDKSLSFKIIDTTLYFTSSTHPFYACDQDSGSLLFLG